MFKIKYLLKLQFAVDNAYAVARAKTRLGGVGESARRAVFHAHHYVVARARLGVAFDLMAGVRAARYARDSGHFAPAAAADLIAQHAASNAADHRAHAAGVTGDGLHIDRLHAAAIRA